MRKGSGCAYRFEQQSEQLKENDTGDQVVDAEDPLTEESGVLAMNRRMQRGTRCTTKQANKRAKWGAAYPWPRMKWKSHTPRTTVQTTKSIA